MVLVYQSPESFLNNGLFTELFFSVEFQSRLILIVRDEAHMIYAWGLVETGKSKHLNAHGRIQDYAVFRPSYGKISDRLMATNNVPLLLLSATCRPIAVESILNSLMIKSINIPFFRGELVRTEIQIMRFPMTHSLKSCNDLLQLFPLPSQTPDNNIVPTLIYSGTRKATLTVIDVLNKARGEKVNAYNSASSFV